LIENGTYDHQQVISATLATLPDRAPDLRLGGPALLIVGEVVALGRRLGWFAGLHGQQGTALSDAD
jgi:siroheme synthase